MLGVGWRSRLLVDDAPQFVDCVPFVEADFGMALGEVGVGEVEDEGGGCEGAVLGGVGGGDVGFEGEEILVLDGGCHDCYFRRLSMKRWQRS